MDSFTQRNVLTKVFLKLNTDYLEYSITDKRGVKTGFNVKYEALPNPFDYRTFRSKDAFVSYPLYLIAVLSLLHLFSGKDDPFSVLLFMAPAGAVCIAIGYALRRWLKKEYTVLMLEPKKNLLIVKDRWHDRIMEELQSRRNAALKKFAVIDRHQPPWQELKKFKFLRDEAIISNDDFLEYRRNLLSSLNMAEISEIPMHKPVLN